ncbi:MAG: Fe-S cluster assembly protein NifU [Planctomycetota bacterium]|jgi:NifU-like protein
MWDYTEKVKDHFKNPRNVGTLEEADGVGEVGSLACGDALKLMFKLDKEGRITEAKFKTFGCASAIASASALTELLRGKTVEEAEAITNQDIAEFLGGLPEEKMHCSVMGREALEAAIANYRGAPSKKQAEGRVVCTCFGVTEPEIERAIRENHLTTVEDVTHYTKAGGGCGNCQADIKAILERVTGTLPPPPTPRKRPSGRMTNIRRIQLIQETIDREVRPILQKDGGDLELVDVDGKTVVVAMRGKCVQCRLAEVTLKDIVEPKLHEFVSEDLVVVEETS